MLIMQKLFIRIILFGLIPITHTTYSATSMTRTALTATKGLMTQAAQTIKAHPKLACAIGVNGLLLMYGEYRADKYNRRHAQLKKELVKLEQQKANIEKQISITQLHDINDPNLTAEDIDLFKHINDYLIQSKNDCEKAVKDLNTQIAAKKAEIALTKEACEAADKVFGESIKIKSRALYGFALAEVDKSVEKTSSFIKAKLTRKPYQKINLTTLACALADIPDYALIAMLATAPTTVGLYRLAQQYHWPKAQLIKNYGIKALKIEGLVLTGSLYISALGILNKMFDERDRAAEAVLKRSKST